MTTETAKEITRALAEGAMMLPEPVRRANEIVCGCGCAEAAWTWIRDYLASREADERPSDPPRQADGAEDGASWLLVYLIDYLGLTEHGYNIANAWLTDDGKVLLAFLREWGVDWRDKAWWVDSTGCSFLPDDWQPR